MAHLAPPFNCYLIAGLSFRSTVVLPAFRADVNRTDVLIHPQSLDTDLGPWSHQGRRFKASPGRWLFAAADGCRFLVQSGRDVAYEAPSGVSAAAIAGHIMQPVLATVLHQRDLLALHASAIETRTGAVIFMGRPVAGKSTLTAWMHGQGYGFIADDVCPVDVRGRPLVAGGFAYQKLAPDVASAVRPSAAAVPIADDLRGRVRVAVRSEPAPPQPLVRGYVLHPGRAAASSGTITIEPLTGAAAFEALVAHTYRRQYLRGLGGLAWHIEACTRVASSVPIYAVSFVPGACDVRQLGTAILDHLGITP